MSLAVYIFWFYGQAEEIKATVQNTPRHKWTNNTKHVLTGKYDQIRLITKQTSTRKKVLKYKPQAQSAIVKR